MGDGQRDVKVLISYRDRWYPGVLETWNTRDGVMRGWVTYSIPVNGWPGGWYEMSDIRWDDTEDRSEDDGEGLSDAPRPPGHD